MNETALSRSIRKHILPPLNICACPTLLHVPYTFTHLTSSRNAPHISTLPSGLTIFTVKIGIFSFQKLQIKGEVPFITLERRGSQILLCLWFCIRNTKSLLNLTRSCSQGYYIKLLSHLRKIIWDSSPCCLSFSQSIFHNATSTVSPE